MKKLILEDQKQFQFQFDIEVIEQVVQQVANEKISTPVEMAFTPVVAEIKKIDKPLFKVDVLNFGSVKDKVVKNLQIIEMVKTQKQFSMEEKTQLAQYTGWGGASGAFDANNEALGSFNIQLKSILDEQEYLQAQDSVLNAYYTEPVVIRAMWKILSLMGFKGGKVLDPSAGIGHFTGCMPMEMRANSSIVMVEPDTISAKILNALYDENSVTVVQSGIEKTQFKLNSFDVAISNIPFGNYRISDSKLDFLKLRIHDYFFAKALSLVRDGGLIAFVTSTGTLDKKDTKFREYLDARAQLVAAIRLPSSAFSRIANTTVVTDIVVLRKLPFNMDEKIGRDFVSINWNHPLNFNACFKEIGSHIIGEIKKTSRYEDSYELVYSGDLDKKLDEIVEELEPYLANWYQPDSNIKLNNVISSISYADTSLIPPGYSFDDHGNLIFCDERGTIESISGKGGRAYVRLEGLALIKQSVLQLLEADSIEEVEIATHSRSLLNRVYDAFIKQFGPVMSPVNRRAFQLDNSAPLIWSLEHYDEELEQHCKSDIFFRSTVSKAKLLDNVDNVSDALALSYNKHGKLNLEFMSQAMNVNSQTLRKELIDANLAFIDPESNECVDAHEYLSGNIRHKLFAANMALSKDSQFTKNVEQLTEVLPVTIPIDEICIQLGAPWIDSEYIEQFIEEVVLNTVPKNIDRPLVKVTHIPSLSLWNVENYGFLNSANNLEWGTPRMLFTRILEVLLNQQQPIIYDTVIADKIEKRVQNPQETLQAKEKAEKIQLAFIEWIKSDFTRASRLELKYNELYNNFVIRTYSGSHLVIPGLNPNISLRPAQLDTIWRGIVSGNVLQALAVGGGKTLTQIVTAMECKRLGLHNKPCLVVPNHMLEAFAAEVMKAFIKAKILVVSKQDMESPIKRKTALMRVATGNWDLVLMTHSTFGKINISAKAINSYKDTIEKQFNDVISIPTNTDNVVKSLLTKKKQALAKVDKLLSRSKDSDILPFDDLGIDLLVVDEADLFKNLWFPTKKTRVAGLSSSCSSRAFDMFIKSRVVFEKLGTNSRGLIFATATPISNTVAEMFIMQTYLQPDALKDHFVDQFDAWAANFGKEVTSLEVAPTNGYRLHTRFCKFQNVPELMRIFRQIAEIRTKKMLNLPVPKIKDGQHQVIVAKPSCELLEYISELVLRSDMIAEGIVNPKDDNMLCITNDGRKAALDMRIIDPSLDDFMGSKVNLCVDKIFFHWEQGNSKKLTQLVFSDLSTPKPSGFSVYTDIRQKLISKGIPTEEIAFAQDFDTDLKKASLHSKVRSGKIRILIGSTELMGFGTNVQDLLVAEHHLDAPWRPRDVEQRDGRIERQGNTNDEIYIYRYVTEKSFDAYMWQTLETKAKFIEQIFEGGDVRSIEDVNSSSLSCSEVKALASGNPLVLQKAGVDNEIVKLSSLKSSYLSANAKMRSRISTTKSNLKLLENSLVLIQSDIDSIDLNNQLFIADHKNFDLSDDLCRYIKQVILHTKDAKFSTYKLLKHCGLTLVINSAFEFKVSGTSGYKYSINLNISNFDRMKDQLQEMIHIPYKTYQEYENMVMEYRQELNDLDVLVVKPFEYEARLKDLMAQQSKIEAALGLLNSEFIAESDVEVENT